ncbi:hypothetical protein PsorP6_009752 [Peronosclerospora sorghi]|uniref:Uncharacterized protein n=1 Tax=Peronosclerospora sorghi TaxID=230839 RepID=A0ACC0VZS3_9STRA|nr:hypothetical protein PsorP6_009752 [Peronosclerospora sorghi]
MTPRHPLPFANSEVNGRYPCLSEAEEEDEEIMCDSVLAEGALDRADRELAALLENDGYVADEELKPLPPPSISYPVQGRSAAGSDSDCACGLRSASSPETRKNIVQFDEVEKGARVSLVHTWGTSQQKFVCSGVLTAGSEKSKHVAKAVAYRLKFDKEVWRHEKRKEKQRRKWQEYQDKKRRAWGERQEEKKWKREKREEKKREWEHIKDKRKLKVAMAIVAKEKGLSFDTLQQYFSAIDSSTRNESK